MKDLVIIGGGIAGITAAIYAKRAGLDFCLITEQMYSSGQIENATIIENYPGLCGTSGVEFSNRLQEELETFEVDVIETKVDHITELSIEDWLKPGWIVYANSIPYETKTIIFAGGAKHRKLDVPYDEKVKFHYCATCDGALYRDKTVAVIGGGNVAFTEALYLSKICKQVMILMCDENITAEQAEVKRVLNTANITLFQNSPVTSITTLDNGFFEIHSNQEDNRDISFTVQGIFVAIGMEPAECPYGLDTDKNGYIIANDMGIPTWDNGFYVAGDVRTKKLRQSITAAADGANCVASVIDYIRRNYNDDK